MFFKKGRASRRGKLEAPRVEPEAKSYDERMDEITQWNIEHTDILKVLQREIQEARLTSWSNALHIGIKKVLKKPAHAGRSPEYEALRDLDQFIANQRIKLLGSATMKEAKGIGKLDPLSVCIVCGIRVLQKQRRLPGVINTLKLKLLERYLG